MDLLSPGVDPEAFFGRIRGAPARVLLLDYDGTLAPFRVERDEAVPWPEAREAVERLIGAGHSRVVVISGRSVEDLRPLLGLEPPPEIWGTHGWERLVPGEGLDRVDPGARAREGLERARTAAEAAAPPGSVEVKPASVAVHVRALDSDRARELEDAVRAAWQPEVRDAGLEIHAFDGGVELRVPGRTKADAVREVLADAPDGTVVAYLGDDLTDEDAFRALGELVEEGRELSTLRVLVRSEPRPTEADARVTPPDGLLDFLERWHREATA